MLAVTTTSVVSGITEVTVGQREKFTFVAGPSFTIILLIVSGIYLKKNFFEKVGGLELNSNTQCFNIIKAQQPFHTLTLSGLSKLKRNKDKWVNSRLPGYDLRESQIKSLKNFLS